MIQKRRNILLFKEYHEKYPSHGYRWLNAKNSFRYRTDSFRCKRYRPMQCIVSDMTAFYVKGIYYELTIYMDLWNNIIISHSLSSKRGDRMTYISGLQDVIDFKNTMSGIQNSFAFRSGICIYIQSIQ